MLHVADLALNLVLRWDVLPRGQEDSLVHLAVLDEQNVQRQRTREVEHVDVVLDSDLCKTNDGFLIMHEQQLIVPKTDLQCCQGVHPLDWPVGSQGQRYVNALVGRDLGHVQLLSRDQAKAATNINNITRVQES